jgi:L-amino acid N-acyltransferase YncA
MDPADAEAVLAIYQEGLDGGDASFETAAPDWPRFDAARLPSHRFVAVAEDGPVLGWAAVSPTSTRKVYAGVVEVSIYVAAAARGQGVGRTLLQTLIDSTEAAGIWTLTAGVFPENAASLAIHQSLGFRQIGVRERIGRDTRRDVWRDVVLLERRSPAVD